MGQGITFKCPSCGHEFGYIFGGGMILPQEKDLEGQEGFEEVKQFVSEHPNGLVDCSLVVRKCSKCGVLANVRDFSMWLPKDENEPLEYGNYFYADRRKYRKYRNVSYICKKCGSRRSKTLNMRDLSDLIQKNGIECPECGKKLGYETVSFDFWD